MKYNVVDVMYIWCFFLESVTNGLRNVSSYSFICSNYHGYSAARVLPLQNNPHCKTYNTELNNLRKIIFENLTFLLKEFQFFYVIEKLAEHGIHCMPSCYTIDLIDILS